MKKFIYLLILIILSISVTGYDIEIEQNNESNQVNLLIYDENQLVNADNILVNIYQEGYIINQITPNNIDTGKYTFELKKGKYLIDAKVNINNNIISKTQKIYIDKKINSISRLIRTENGNVRDGVYVFTILIIITILILIIIAIQSNQSYYNKKRQVRGYVNE